ncbi:MAG TPA: hypothetical protein VN829_12450, partial [Dongiaceae bacterium]|nr:hypothetical protein [Dongiaceae bacterium]
MSYLRFIVGYIVGLELALFKIAPFFGYDFAGTVRSLDFGERIRLIFLLCPVVVALLGSYVSGMIIAKKHDRTGDYDLSHLGFFRNVCGPILITHYMVFAGAFLLFVGNRLFYFWADQFGRSMTNVWLFLISPIIGVGLG